MGNLTATISVPNTPGPGASVSVAGMGALNRQIAVSGGTTGDSFNLEGSIDNANFYVVQTFQPPGAGGPAAVRSLEVDRSLFYRANRVLGATPIVLTCAGEDIGVGGGFFGSAVFSSGSDGNLVFDGTSTVLGIVPSALTYILNRDIFPANMTVAGGVVIKTASWKIEGNGTLTGPASTTATIQNNGGNGGNGVAGGTAGAAGARVGAGSLGRGAAGSLGAAGSNNGVNGNSIAAGYAGIATTGGAGGGAGGSTGGLAGANTPITAVQGGIENYQSLMSGLAYATGGLTEFLAGASGGGGAGDNADAGGGGSGAGGGYLAVAFPSITGNIAFQANGGNGGNGASTANNAGGGGGGQGGIAVVAYHTLAATVSITAAGGLGGAAVGTGVAGSAGGAGIVRSLPV